MNPDSRTPEPQSEQNTIVGLSDPAVRGSPTLHWPQDVREPADPGTPSARLGALVAVVVLTLATFVLQQRAASAPEVSDPTAPLVSSQYDFASRLMLKMHEFFKSNDAKAAESAQKVFLENIDGATRPGDKLAAAVGAGEIAGDPAAIERLDALDAVLERVDAAKNPDAERLQRTAARLRTVYTDGVAALSDADREKLKADLGWYGELAVTHGTDDASRQTMLAGGGLFLGVMALVLLVALGAIVGGVTCGIIAMVMASNGKFRRTFVPPAPGGSVFLETLAVFLLAFLAIKFVALGVKLVRPGTDDETITLLAMGLQGLSALIIFWPVARGMPWSQWRRAVGWHSGRGFFREVGAGLFGYFASLPLLFGAMVVTMVLVLIKTAIDHRMGREPTSMRNRIFDMAGGGGAELVALFVLATVWAPIVEETLFRGSLFRHLRSRVGFLSAAVVSALAFGVVHGYPWFALLPVITLGSVFAWMREWRGSLIAPMTAHMLNNATVLTLLFLMLHAMGL